MHSLTKRTANGHINSELFFCDLTDVHTVNRPTFTEKILIYSNTNYDCFKQLDAAKRRPEVAKRRKSLLWSSGRDRNDESFWRKWVFLDNVIYVEQESRKFTNINSYALQSNKVFLFVEAHVRNEITILYSDHNTVKQTWMKSDAEKAKLYAACEISNVLATAIGGSFSVFSLDYPTHETRPFQSESCIQYRLSSKSAFSFLVD